MCELKTALIKLLESPLVREYSNATDEQLQYCIDHWKEYHNPDMRDNAEAVLNAIKILELTK